MQHIRNTFSLLVLFSLIGINAYSQDKLIDKVIAKVGSEHILLSDVEEEFSYSKTKFVNYVNQFSEAIIYPKPATNYFSIKSNEKVLKINILDASGQVAKVFDKCIGRLDISTIQPGLYYVEVINSNETQFQKLYVKN